MLVLGVGWFSLVLGMNLTAATGRAAPLLEAKRRGRTGETQRMDRPVSQETKAVPTPEGMVDPRDDGLEVGMGEWAISLEKDIIRPGLVTFKIHNGGARTHGFRIRSTSHRRGRDRFEARTHRLPPGGQTELTVSLPNGVYEVDCYVEEPGVGEHDQLGMETTLMVQADAPLVPTRPVPLPSAVVIERFAFSPSLLKVKVGTTVAWTNKDPLPHTVTMKHGRSDSGLLASEATYRQVFNTPGVFPYTCTVHPNMQGQIEVSQ